MPISTLDTCVALVSIGSTGNIPRVLLKIPTLRTFHLENNQFRGNDYFVCVKKLFVEAEIRGWKVEIQPPVCTGRHC